MQRILPSLYITDKIGYAVAKSYPRDHAGTLKVKRTVRVSIPVTVEVEVDVPVEFSFNIENNPSINCVGVDGECVSVGCPSMVDEARAQHALYEAVCAAFPEELDAAIEKEAVDAVESLQQTGND